MGLKEHYSWYVFNENDFACLNIDDFDIAQEWMYMFGSFETKKAKDKAMQDEIETILGGKDNWKDAKKVIKKDRKDIENNFPDIQYTDVSDLPEDD